MSMNIGLRLNGQHIAFRYQTTTDETYRIVFEDFHHLKPDGKPIQTTWRPSSQKRRWEKLRQLMYSDKWHFGPTKREAKAHFHGKPVWMKRVWRENRKELWRYLCWIRDTPGMEIVWG